MTAPERFDVIVVGSGPAGQKAAIQAAKAGRRVAVIEQEAHVGGACVHLGTIPSKTLRETAQALLSFRRRSGDCFQIEAREDLKIQSLMRRLEQVVAGHQETVRQHFARNAVAVVRGRARFLDPWQLQVVQVGGATRTLRGEIIVIASGSRPREPEGMTIDHTHVLDSDSILSMNYLPQSLTVLGAGVIACEYASIFAALGVAVTIVDSGPRPLAFLDAELTALFLQAFARVGGTFIGQRRIERVESDGVVAVDVTLAGGETITSEKVLVALGRVANVAGLNIAAAGLTTTGRGVIAVDETLRTSQPHIFAAGDVIGPPALAASAMEQGRRAVCHALGLAVGATAETIPVGIYTIPEMSSVGLSEDQARERHGEVIVGRASFGELARGQIAALDDGLLKLIVASDGRTLLGVQIVGEGATDLIHVGQLALVGQMPVDTFVDNIFNFPTLTEAYRVAALDVIKQRHPSPASRRERELEVVS